MLPYHVHTLSTCPTETSLSCGLCRALQGRSGPFTWGNPNGGLAQKAPIGPKKALSGEFLLPPTAVRFRRIGSDQPQKGPGTLRKGSNQARKGPDFPKKDFCPIFSAILGLKPPFVSPRLALLNLDLLQDGHGSIWFCYGSCVGRFERFWFSVPTVPLWKGLFYFNSVFITKRDGSGFGS